MNTNLAENVRCGGYSSASQPSIPRPKMNQSSSSADDPRPLVYLDSLLALPHTTGDASQAEVPLTMFRDVPANENVPSVVIPAPLPAPETQFLLLQSWEGHVLQVHENSFMAHVIDKTSGGPDQEVEFDLDEISPSDRSLVCEGAIFYWDIGYSEERGGQRIRSSLIQFRRLPAWTARELKAAREGVAKIKDAIGWSRS